MLTRAERAGYEAYLAAVVAVYHGAPLSADARAARDHVLETLAADQAERDEREARRRDKRTQAGAQWAEGVE